MRDPKRPRQFTEEFRRQIVALVDSGKLRAEVMREYDLGKSTLDRWIRRVHACGSTAAADNRPPRPAAFGGERPGKVLRRPRAAHPRRGRPRLRARRRLVVLRVPARRPLQPRDSRLLARAAQGRAAGQGRLFERGVPAHRHRGLPQRQGVGVLQRGCRRAALGLRNREVGLAPRQPLRQRGCRVDEQGAQARAGARAGVPVGGPAEDGALRLGELVQRLQAALDARLHDAGRVQGGGLDPLVALSKKVLPYHCGPSAPGRAWRT